MHRELFSRTDPKAVIVADLSEELSLGDLSLRSQTSAQSILLSSAKHKNPMGVLRAEPTVEFVVHFFAFLQSGIPFVVIPSGMHPMLLQSLLSDLNCTPSDPPSAFCVVGRRAKLHPRCALLLLTAGTTGLPKLAQLSLPGIQENIASVAQSLGLAGSDRQFLCLPLHHSFGLLSQLLPAVSLGMRTFLAPGPAALRHEKLSGELFSVLSGTPPLLKQLGLLLSEEQRLSIKKVVSAGDYFSGIMKKQVSEIFPQAEVSNNYGLTECTSRVMSISSSQRGFFEDSCIGNPVQNVETRISSGELLVKSAKNFLGYLEGGEAASEAAEEAGYLRTGDLVEARGGFHYLLGRADGKKKSHGVGFVPKGLYSAVKKIPYVKDLSVEASLDPELGTNIVSIYLTINASAAIPTLSGFLLQLDEFFASASLIENVYARREGEERPGAQLRRC